LRLSLKPVPPDLRMSAVGHLEELRARLIRAGSVFAVCFALCLWQSGPLLRIIDRPLARAGSPNAERHSGAGSESQLVNTLGLLARPGSGLHARTRAQLRASVLQLQREGAHAQQLKPVTLGLSEPFTATLQVALLCALLLSAPILLYQLYAYIAPAIGAGRGAVAWALLGGCVLFYTGAAFGYYVALPAMVHFLTHFSEGSYTVLIQAGPYYRLTLLTVAGLGVAFQLPLLVLALAASGAVSATSLRKARRYVLVGCAAVGAMLPGEVITMALGAAPLYLMFELSLVAARVIERRRLAAGAPAAGDAASA